MSNILYLFISLGPVSILFLLEKNYKFKTKLIHRFETIKKYEYTISIIFLAPLLILLWFRFFSDTSLDFGWEIVFLPYLYLTHIPKELRRPSN